MTHNPKNPSSKYALYYRGPKKRKQVCPNCRKLVTFCFYPDSRLTFYCSFCGRLEGRLPDSREAVFCLGEPCAEVQKNSHKKT